eukprot:CAMPEP_0185907194 /NCGR_PEP_ID=MMETSP0196C-20130402/6600_1 /TAXON_ID=2932 /ORGANISM="Alexandrium fundyense, Strain CCMP1719" /LENGTH=67 /DNA_ID=CAMNT_0028627105 /DNA_START=60 /DNA_END=260 /DNA_ORIENTATION=+
MPMSRRQMPSLLAARGAALRLFLATRLLHPVLGVLLGSASSPGLGATQACPLQVLEGYLSGLIVVKQ